jgi:hypothetical protein
VISIPKRRLDRLVGLMRDYNVPPLHLAAFHSPEPQHPLSAALARVLADMETYLFAASREEMLAITATLPTSLQMMLNFDCLQRREPAEVKRTAIWLLVNQINNDYFDITPYLRPIDSAKSKVLRLYPELADYQTDEELLPLHTEGLRPFQAGIFYKKHLLYYHQFLRRYFTSSPNYDFLHTLSSYAARTGSNVSVSVAVDHYRIMPSKLFHQYMEFDRWYGPPFHWDFVDDPHVIGLTVYSRSKESASNLAYALNRTEFLWTYRNGIKTIQIEEIRPVKPGSSLGGFMLNRYIHSRRDVSTRKFIHLDGAVKVYKAASYEDRYNTRLGEGSEAKSDHKIKLFRIDDPEIQQDSWSELVSYFFRQNEMVLEYLNSDYEETEAEPPK